MKNKTQSRVTKKLQGISMKTSSNEQLRAVIKDNKQHITDEKSIVSVSKGGYNRNFSEW